MRGFRFHTKATAYKFRIWIFPIEDRGRKKETDRKHYGGYQRSIHKKCQNIKTQVTKIIPPWRKVINYFCRDQCGTNVRCQLTTTTTFCAVLLNVCGSSELNLLHVTLLAPGILRWILFFFFGKLLHPCSRPYEMPLLQLRLCVWCAEVSI